MSFVNSWKTLGNLAEVIGAQQTDTAVASTQLNSNASKLIGILKKPSIVTSNGRTSCDGVVDTMALSVPHGVVGTTAARLEHGGMANMTSEKGRVLQCEEESDEGLGDLDDVFDDFDELYEATVGSYRDSTGTSVVDSSIAQEVSMCQCQSFNRDIKCSGEGGGLNGQRVAGRNSKQQKDICICLCPKRDVLGSGSYGEEKTSNFSKESVSSGFSDLDSPDSPYGFEKHHDSLSLWPGKGNDDVGKTQDHMSVVDIDSLPLLQGTGKVSKVDEALDPFTMLNKFINNDNSDAVIPYSRPWKTSSSSANEPPSSENTQTSDKLHNLKQKQTSCVQTSQGSGDNVRQVEGSDVNQVHSEKVTFNCDALFDFPSGNGNKSSISFHKTDSDRNSSVKNVHDTSTVQNVNNASKNNTWSHFDQQNNSGKVEVPQGQLPIRPKLVRTLSAPNRARPGPVKPKSVQFSSYLDVVEIPRVCDLELQHDQHDEHDNDDYYEGRGGRFDQQTHGDEETDGMFD